MTLSWGLKGGFSVELQQKQRWVPRPQPGELAGLYHR